MQIKNQSPCVSWAQEMRPNAHLAHDITGDIFFFVPQDAIHRTAASCLGKDSIEIGQYQGEKGTHGNYRRQSPSQSPSPVPSPSLQRPSLFMDDLQSPSLHEGTILQRPSSPGHSRLAIAKIRLAFSRRYLELADTVPKTNHAAGALQSGQNVPVTRHRHCQSRFLIQVHPHRFRPAPVVGGTRAPGNDIVGDALPVARKRDASRAYLEENIGERFPGDASSGPLMPPECDHLVRLERTKRSHDSTRLRVRVSGSRAADPPRCSAWDAPRGHGSTASLEDTNTSLDTSKA